VILDEVHHTSNVNTWGVNAQNAFDLAYCVLLNSGTPWRSDEIKIPFVRYDPVDHTCIADFPYDHQQARADRIIRKVSFPKNDAVMSWISKGKTYQATFNGTVPNDELSHQLHTALWDLNYAEKHGKDGLAAQLIRDAHRHLQRVREKVPNAAMLIIAMKTEHADAIAKLVQDVTGIVPVLAHSDVAASHARIAAFKESTDMYLVSVRMVGEGVDIPRIVGGAWLTNILTSLSFAQIIARGIRKLTVNDRTIARWFLPDHPVLRAHASKYEEPYKPGAEDALEEDDGNGDGNGDGDGIGDKTFFPLGTDSPHLTGVVFRHLLFSPAEIADAETRKVQDDLEAAVEEVALMMGLGTPITPAKVVHTAASTVTASRTSPAIPVAVRPATLVGAPQTAASLTAQILGGVPATFAAPLHKLPVQSSAVVLKTLKTKFHKLAQIYVPLTYGDDIFTNATRRDEKAHAVGSTYHRFGIPTRPQNPTIAELTRGVAAITDAIAKLTANAPSYTPY
jgi:hypothetical protein